MYRHCIGCMKTACNTKQTHLPSGLFLFMKTKSCTLSHHPDSLATPHPIRIQYSLQQWPKECLGIAGSASCGQTAVLHVAGCWGFTVQGGGKKFSCRSWRASILPTRPDRKRPSPDTDQCPARTCSIHPHTHTHTHTIFHSLIYLAHPL